MSAPNPLMALNAQPQAPSPMLLAWEQKNDLAKGSGFAHKSRLCTLVPAVQSLPAEDQGKLDAAKGFARDINIRAALNKQATLQQQQQQMTRLKREQALILLSRIYVGSIHSEVKEEQVRAQFLAFGPIKNLDMGWDATLKKHKNFAFIEFEMPEASILAIDAMNGMALGHRCIKVSRPNSMPDTGPIIAQLISEGKLACWVYVASVHPELVEDDVRSVFEAFGKIKTCILVPDTLRPGKHRSFGFVEYDSEQAAKDAIASMNGFDLGGQHIRVGPTLSQPYSIIPDELARQQRLEHQLQQGQQQQQQQEQQEAGSPGNSGWSPASSGGGGNNSNSGYPPVAVVNPVPAPTAKQKQQQQQPSSVLLLENMVTAEEVDDTLSSEVGDECSKYGAVQRVHIEATGQFPRIFVAFIEPTAAKLACDGLTGRYFGGRLVSASLFDPERFANGNL